MIVYCSKKGRVWTAWIEEDGKRIWEASGSSQKDAIWNLFYALSQRDDPNAKPVFKIVE
jgi:hypothetical protein